ncbi:splicing factor, proline- and glutamine-rich-like [Ochotona princeps]|uniref:splicing factor, proline- and glutamine-rich-like n=1 Tax=Ochotona princeps TaxID=9978 RepID=UPI002714D81C|nr:splicing factor, proline- and glutamine-rich-like [Ochotona princeps]
MLVEGPGGRKSPSSPAPSPLRRAPPVAGSSSSLRFRESEVGPPAFPHRPPPGPQAPPSGPAGSAPRLKHPQLPQVSLRSSGFLLTTVLVPPSGPPAASGLESSGPHRIPLHPPPTASCPPGASGFRAPGVLERVFQTPPRRARLPAAGPRQNGGVVWNSPWAFRYLSSASCEPAFALWRRGRCWQLLSWNHERSQSENDVDQGGETEMSHLLSHFGNCSPCRAGPGLHWKLGLQSREKRSCLSGFLLCSWHPLQHLTPAGLSIVSAE